MGQVLSGRFREHVTRATPVHLRIVVNVVVGGLFLFTLGMVGLSDGEEEAIWKALPTHRFMRPLATSLTFCPSVCVFHEHAYSPRLHSSAARVKVSPFGHDPRHRRDGESVMGCDVHVRHRSRGWVAMVEPVDPEWWPAVASSSQATSAAATVSCPSL